MKQNRFIDDGVGLVIHPPGTPTPKRRPRRNDQRIQEFHLAGQHDQQTHGNRNGSGGSWRQGNGRIARADGTVLTREDGIAARAVADYFDSFDVVDLDLARRLLKWATPGVASDLGDLLEGPGLGSDAERRSKLAAMFKQAPPASPAEFDAALSGLLATHEKIHAPDANVLARTRAMGIRRQQEMLGDPNPVVRSLAVGARTWSGTHHGVGQYRQGLEAGDSEAVMFRDAIRQAPPTDIELYRGMTSGRSEERWAAWDSLEPGDTINLDQIGSFTESRTHADSFGRVSITMKPGARALPIEAISNTPKEREWLVAGDIQVVSVTPTGPGAEGQTTDTLWAFDDIEVGPGFDIVVEYIGPNQDPDEIALAASAGVSAVEMIAEVLGTPLHLDSNGSLPRLAAAVEQLHLKGTANDHDQSTHARGRIAPVSGATIKKTISTDLTMNGDALTDKVKAKIIDRLETSLGVTPEEAEAHLVHMAEGALPKGLPGQDWYQIAHDEAVAAAEGSGIDPDVAVAITAALSPGTPWDQNRENALHLMEAFSRRSEPLDPHIMKLANDWGDKIDGSTGEKNATVNANQNDTFDTLYARDPHVAAVYLAKLANASVGYSYDNFFKATELMVLNDRVNIDPVLKGAKVRSFYNNLLQPSGTSGDVTVDVHMQRAMANDTGFTSAQEKYDRTISIKKMSSTITGTPSQDGAALGAMPVMADAIRGATATFNDTHGTSLLPHQFQAIVWTEQISQYPPQRIKELMRGRELSPDVG